MESGNTEITTSEINAYQDGYDAALGRGRYEGQNTPKVPRNMSIEEYPAWWDGFRDGIGGYMESIRIGT